MPASPQAFHIMLQLTQDSQHGTSSIKDLLTALKLLRVWEDVSAQASPDLKRAIRFCLASSCSNNHLRYLASSRAIALLNNCVQPFFARAYSSTRYNGRCGHPAPLSPFLDNSLVAYVRISQSGVKYFTFKSFGHLIMYNVSYIRLVDTLLET